MRPGRVILLTLISCVLLSGQILVASSAVLRQKTSREQRQAGRRVGADRDLILPTRTPPEEQLPSQGPADPAPFHGEEVEPSDVTDEFVLTQTHLADMRMPFAEAHYHPELLSLIGLTLYSLHRLQI